MIARPPVASGTLGLVRLLMLLCLAPLLGAQEASDPWSKMRLGNPPGLEFTLRILDPHPFRQGELIKAKLVRPEYVPGAGPPPPEDWQFIGILLDPPADCGTVVKPCFSNEPGGVIGRPVAFMPSNRRSFALNFYLPGLSPGRYRVAGLSGKVVLRASAPGEIIYGASDPQQYAVSNAVEIEILAASDAWVKDTVLRSAAILKAPESQGVAGYEAQQDAAEQLAFLNDPAAWVASLEALPREESTLLSGLAGGRPQAQVCELMKTRIAAPSQSVSSAYLYSQAVVCANATLPPVPDRGSPERELQAWHEKRRVSMEESTNQATAALAGSLGSKQGAAKWDAFATLLRSFSQGRADHPKAPDPAWIPQLKAAFTREFASIEPARKNYLLGLYASVLASPDIIPLLESVLDGWKPGDYYEAPRSALVALNRIDPGRAQSRILAELRKDKTWLDVASLSLLPPSAAPPMDDALVEGLARAQSAGAWNPALNAAAVARYASAAALPRVRAIYESQQDRCQPELAAYFVRVDPAYADGIFHEHPWDMHAPVPRCTLQYFEQTPPLAMGPPLERFLAAYLMHSDVYVKSTAARVLERYGTTASLPALWGAFRYFHDYWNGKGSELAQNIQGVQLEVDLRNAIGHGRGWLVSEADLRTMESLCISGRCVGDARNDLESIKAPLRIEILGEAPQFMARVAQYFSLDSLPGLESKLAQYPRGTRFVLYAAGAPWGGEEVQRFAKAKGLAITLPEVR